MNFQFFFHIFLVTVGISDIFFGNLRRKMEHSQSGKINPHALAPRLTAVLVLSMF